MKRRKGKESNVFLKNKLLEQATKKKYLRIIIGNKFAVSKHKLRDWEMYKFEVYPNRLKYHGDMKRWRRYTKERYYLSYIWITTLDGSNEIYIKQTKEYQCTKTDEHTNCQCLPHNVQRSTVHIGRIYSYSY